MMHCRASTDPISLLFSQTRDIAVSASRSMIWRGDVTAHDESREIGAGILWRVVASVNIFFVRSTGCICS